MCSTFCNTYQKYIEIEKYKSILQIGDHFNKMKSNMDLIIEGDDVMNKVVDLETSINSLSEKKEV